jgi:hypothetical protein
MGEARRRMRRMELPQGGKWVQPDAPEIRKLIAKDQPVNVYLIGAGIILHRILSIPKDQLMEPQYRPVRLAFSMFDRIRTGEITPWQCFLCAREFHGLAGLSVFALIERTLGDPLPTKPAMVMPICATCDGVSTEETRRRVEQVYGLSKMQEGHA